MDGQEVLANPPDLLFAWLNPMERKAGDKLRPYSPTLNLPAASPFAIAKSALRKSIRASQIGRKARNTQGLSS